SIDFDEIVPVSWQRKVIDDCIWRFKAIVVRRGSIKERYQMSPSVVDSHDRIDWVRYPVRLQRRRQAVGQDFNRKQLAGVTADRIESALAHAKLVLDVGVRAAAFDVSLHAHRRHSNG